MQHNERTKKYFHIYTTIIMIPLLHLYYKKNMTVEEKKIHKEVMMINDQLVQSDNILLTLNMLLPDRDVRMKVLKDAMKLSLIHI